MTKLSRDSYRMGEILFKSEYVYDRYARSLGMSGTAHQMLYILSDSGPYTQKQLCEQMLLPKQTVNSIVKAYERDGIIEGIVMKEDKRHKQLCLTQKGRELADKVLPKVYEAEVYALEQFSDEERGQLFNLLERYVNALGEKMQ